MVNHTNNMVKINMTEEDIQELMDRAQRLNAEGNEKVFLWNFVDSNDDLILVEISVGDDPE